MHIGVIGCWALSAVYFVDIHSGRQRSHTEGVLRHADTTIGFSARRLSEGEGEPEDQFGRMTHSRSFTERQGIARTFGSSSRLADVRQRPSFAQDVRDNKENIGRRESIGELSPSTFQYAQSPPNMEGPVMFVAPELTTETLMNREHRETLSKLQYVSTLVESLVDLAQSRNSPLLESHQANKLTGCVVFVSEKQRRMEQLIIYIRALHILSSSLQLAKDQVTSGQLQPSPTVKSGTELGP